MRFLVRVAMGVGLGLAAVVGLSFLMKWWIVAILGALLALVGFLGSFFVWSADRPEEGYEQVLFDKPNSILSGVLVLAFVGAAFGMGWLLEPVDEGPNLPPAEAAAVSSMNAERVKLHDVLVLYLNDPKSAKVSDWSKQADESKAAVAQITAPDRLQPLLTPLKSLAESLSAILAVQARCNQGDSNACVDAQIGRGDLSRLDTDYVTAAKDLGVV